MKRMQALAPPPKRIVSMDVLRGIAVLGILLANISYFVGPSADEMTPWRDLALSQDEGWMHAVREAFVSGKMRSLLALLFGAGLWMQHAKLASLDRIAEEKEQAAAIAEGREPGRIKKLWPGRYAARTGLLLAIGLFHGIFIWYGDILAVYAICAFVTLAFVRVSDKILLWVAGVAIAFGAISGLGLGVLIETGIGAMSPDTPFLGAASETRIYSMDGYLMQTAHRAVVVFLSYLNLIFIAPPILGLFLAGMMLARRGLFSGGEQAHDDRRRMLIYGLGIGLPLNLIPLALRALDLPPYATMVIEGGFAPLLAFGLLALFLTLLPYVPGVITDPFRRVGKIALTSYLLQSVLCTALSYSWGFRLFGQLDWKQELSMVAGVWAVCLLFAALWTRCFSIGPVEWVWRSGVERTWLPWRDSKPASVSARADG